jgi:CubicO group peptidase (beta-lactamase class C family)
MKTITRRSLLSNGIKSTVALVALKEFGFANTMSVAAREFQSADQLRPAFQKLDEFIARHMSETGLPGMTLAIANRNGLLREAQYGFADLKAGVKVGPQTLFEIGSISKSFVALALLQLVDEGKLDLQKPLVSYLPWLKVESAYPPFTTHHVLSHTAGLSAVPLLTRVATSTIKTTAEPGKRFVYSNIGYVLLGFLLEAIDKRPFAESLYRRVFEPLGMSSSAATITNEIRDRIAVGYGPLKDDRPFPLKGTLGEAPWLEVGEAAGSVAATARDMGAYLQTLLNRGMGPRSRIISEKSFALLTAPVIETPFRGEPATYGYGLFNSNADGHMLLRHTGGMVAFSSAMYADVTEGIGAFASVNARVGGYRPVAVTNYALKLVSAANGGRELPPLPPPPPSPTKIANAADYAGTYKDAAGGKLVLTSEGEQLVLEHKNRRIVLEQAGRDRFIVKDPDFEMFLLSFGRADKVVAEAFHGTRWWTNEHYVGPKEFGYLADWDAFTGKYRSDNAWYGITRVLIRKGKLLLDGEQPMLQVTPGVFRMEGEDNGERISFDQIVNGKAQRMNFSGIEFYRTFTR